MSQILKKETCTGECYPKCPVYNVLQRRIGNRRITDWDTIESMGLFIQKERCPGDQTLDTTNLNPSRQKPRRSLIW